MLYDPANPVVQLCAKGIEIEYTGDLERAGELYRQAWEEASCTLEACTAAHYLARVQTDPGESMRWNLLALEHYVLAERACVALPEDGYGKMIRNGIEAGLSRMTKLSYGFPDKKSI